MHLLPITDNLTIGAENKNEDVVLQILGEARINVQGHVQMYRSENNTSDHRNKLYLSDNAGLYVSGNFTYDYKSSDNGENHDEIHLDGNAIIEITGDMELFNRGGNDLEISLEDASQLIVLSDFKARLKGGNKLILYSDGLSHFKVKGDALLSAESGDDYVKIFLGNLGGKVTVEGNLSMNSEKNNRRVKLIASGATSVIKVFGDVSMRAENDGSVYIDLQSSSIFHIGGNFMRPTAYGSLYMGEESTLDFNGSVAQRIPKSYMDGAGSDGFNFTNVTFNNTSDSPFELEGPLTVTNDLRLTEGVIKTSNTNLLILADGAKIVGGNSNSFIDGPLTKIGTTDDETFVFPVGSGNTFAPIEIKTPQETSSRFTAEYIPTTPPDNSNVNSPLLNVSSTEYWSLVREDGVEIVDVNLHWQDAKESNISSLSRLEVAYYDSSTLSWFTLENDGTTGGIGEGNSGSVSAKCPPPFYDKFTFGIRSAQEISVNYSPIYNDAQTLGENGSLEGINPGGNNLVGSAQNRSAFESYSQMDIEEMILFPNPVSDFLQIRGVQHKEDKVYVEILDPSGKVLHAGEKELFNGSLDYNMDQINITFTGTYFIRLYTSGGIRFQKFIKTD